MKTNCNPTVANASCNRGSGNYVTIQHDDRRSHYAHLSKVSVSAGTTVQAGAKVGESGNSGDSTAPHLHYQENTDSGTRLNPGALQGRHGSRVVSYPSHLGHSSWAQVPAGTNLRHDGPPSTGDLSVAGQSVWADFNGDGRSDVGWAQKVGSDWRLFYRRGGSGGQISRGLLPSGDLSDVVFGDFDGNGTTDFAWISRGDLLWRKDSNGARLRLGPGWSHGDETRLRVGDFNGDGRSDVAWAQKVGSDWRLFYRRGGSGGQISRGLLPSGDLSDVVFGDFDGNCTTDLAWIGGGDLKVRWNANGAQHRLGPGWGHGDESRLRSGSTLPRPRCRPPSGASASQQALVRNLHIDLVGRPPTASELSTWTSQLSAGTRVGGDLADALRRSSSSTTSIDPVARLYLAYFLRLPDADGLDFWIAEHRAGRSLAAISDDFRRSSEFTTRYGQLSNRQFVERVYLNVLGRAGEPAGMEFWTRELDTGRRTQGTVMVGFSESTEYARSQAEVIDAAVAHILLLDRAPTTAETSAWVARQKAGTAHRTLMSELLASPAYAAHIASR